MASVDDLWLTDFGEPYAGEPAMHRPALAIGPPDTFGTGFPFVIVMPLTTAHRALSLNVEVEASTDTGLDTTSYVQCSFAPSTATDSFTGSASSTPTSATRSASSQKTLLNF